MENNSEISLSCLPLVPCLVYSSSESDVELPTKSKTRNKKPYVDRKKWFAYKNRRAREKGSKYCGRVRNDTKWVYGKEKEPRFLKERCKCDKAAKGKLNCHEIEDDTRQEIFTKFWKKLTWAEKKTYIDEHVKSLPIKRHRGRKNQEESKRTQSLEYYLTKNDVKYRVCRTMLLNTLSIGRSAVLSWKNKMKNKEEQNCRPSQ